MAGRRCVVYVDAAAQGREARVCSGFYTLLFEDHMLDTADKTTDERSNRGIEDAVAPIV